MEVGIQACKESMTYIESLDEFSKEEFDVMKTTIHNQKPLFNNEQSNKFNRVLPELKNRSFQDVEERRRKHPDARFIEEFLSESEVLEWWMECRVKFIKAYYY